MKAIAVAAILASTPAMAADGWTLHSKFGNTVHVVLIDEGRVKDEALYRSVADGLCGRVSSPVCKVAFWKRGDDAPKAFPMTDRQASTQLADYGRNARTGHAAMLWSCPRFAKPKSECF